MRVREQLLDLERQRRLEIEQRRIGQLKTLRNQFSTSYSKKAIEYLDTAIALLESENQCSGN
jgi:hypothetical protein